MSHLLIVGKKFSSLTQYLAEHGYEYTFLQDITTTKFPEKRFKHRALADFSTKQSLLKAVDALKDKPDGVIATYENYILAAAWIAEHLGVAGIPVAAAEACTDKTLMRQLFQNASEKISPDFQHVTSLEDLKAFAGSHRFPLILKPANLSKSLLVTKNHSLEELLENYQKSLDLLATTYKKYAPGRTPKLLIEEFLEGTIHSVDAFVDSTGTPHILEQIVDYQTGYDIGYDDNFHYSRIMPSKLSDDQQRDFRHCADVAIRSLGMKSSPAHVEIIVTDQGPRIVEVGARNGGYRERMHWLANGIDISQAAIALSLGQNPDITPTKDEPCAVLELFPKTPGYFSDIGHNQELSQLASLSYFSIKAKPGTYIGKAADGYKMAAVIILHNPDVEQFSKDLLFVNESVSVITNPLVL